MILKKFQRLSRVCVFAVMLLFARSGIASLQVDFVEGAPKDQFLITNIGQCDIDDLVLHIDLSTTAGQLIFDTTASGDGVEVFQPFEIRTGDLTLISSDSVMDGDKKLSIRIRSVRPGGVVSFTIDVDDTLVKSDLGKIRITDAEIKNGSIRAQLSGVEDVTALFGGNGTATIAIDVC